MAGVIYFLNIYFFFKYYQRNQNIQYQKLKRRRNKLKNLKSWKERFDRKLFIKLIEQ